MQLDSDNVLVSNIATLEEGPQKLASDSCTRNSIQWAESHTESFTEAIPSCNKRFVCEEKKLIIKSLKRQIRRWRSRCMSLHSKPKVRETTHLSNSQNVGCGSDYVCDEFGDDETDEDGADAGDKLSNSDVYKTEEDKCDEGTMSESDDDYYECPRNALHVDPETEGYHLPKFIAFWHMLANETKSSVGMELEGAKRCFQNLKKDGICYDTFISDRHRVIITWMQNDKKSTNYLFHIWHVARNITKKLMQASKEKGFEIIGKWSRAVCNHIYWAASTTKSGFEGL